MSATDSKTAARLNEIAPSFLVADVVKTAEYYRDRLGFTIGEYFDNPPVFTIVSRDSARITLQRAEGRAATSNRELKKIAGDAYVWVSGIDALYADIKARGATVTAPVDRIYGIREIETVDPDGHVITFGQPPR